MSFLFFFFLLPGDHSLVPLFPPEKTFFAISPLRVPFSFQPLWLPTDLFGDYFFFFKSLFHTPSMALTRPLAASTKPTELGMSRTITSTEVSVRNVCPSYPVSSTSLTLSHPLYLTLSIHFQPCTLAGSSTLRGLLDVFFQVAHPLHQ